jgi:hypothetical protein
LRRDPCRAHAFTLAFKAKFLAGNHKTRPIQTFISCRAMTTNTEYFVITSRQNGHPERWSYEIQRRSTAMGVKLIANGFQSEAAAKFSGERALNEFLSELSKEERRTSR